jgi:nitrate reductase delta subunit
MLGFVKKSAAHKDALRRVKAWTRTRFRLPDDAAILVSELACAVPGCPPIETVVAFWTEGDQRHHFKIFKSVADVVEDDLPPSWMKDALVESEVFGCPCC